MGWIEECKVEALVLTKEKRQEFLDLIHQGKKLGEAQDACGISFNAANGVMVMNIKEHGWMSLQTKTE